MTKITENEIEHNSVVAKNVTTQKITIKNICIIKGNQ